MVGVGERRDRDRPVGVRPSPYRPINPGANGQPPLGCRRRAGASHQLHHGYPTRAPVVIADNTHENVRRIRIGRIRQRDPLAGMPSDAGGKGRREA
jgi:hypothetical protein